ncbi:Pr6Pr family membrane protein [Pseudomonas vanderleydeniana]|uniref:Pr6Pr family membrane protein n=1 Tax=Pseudomonas vanderleydeniana TaxID=2745495 RepID=A0A9E6PJ89_9PSED|nr:Pr6Pr family membrane protein [Pseudomonas vanderleydeniana]QXI27544.1 Pr6Pr family membrane protein [Pseudomonas vanderleydeniana]
MSAQRRLHCACSRMALLAAAVLGWVGLGIQMYLILIARWQAGASLMGGLVTFFSFFTVLTNTLVAVVLTCEVTSRDSVGRRFFLKPAVRTAIVANIVVVGLAYNLLLRPLWHPQGFQWLADELLHDVMPLLFVVYWWRCVPKGDLRFSQVLPWLIYPLVYFAYVLLRGHLIGAYPYPFVDVDRLGYPQVFINAGRILLGFLLVSLVLIGVDRGCGRRRA